MLTVSFSGLLSIPLTTGASPATRPSAADALSSTTVTILSCTGMVLDIRARSHETTDVF